MVDEIKTHLRVQQKVLRSHTPEGVRQELYALFLVHFAIRALMSRSALQAELDPDRLSFTEAVPATSPVARAALAHQPSGAQASLSQVQTQEARCPTAQAL